MSFHPLLVRRQGTMWLTVLLPDKSASCKQAVLGGKIEYLIGQHSTGKIAQVQKIRPNLDAKWLASHSSDVPVESGIWLESRCGEDEWL